MQSLFQRGSGPLLRVLLFVLLSVVLMVVDQRFSQLDRVRVWLSGAIAPLQYAIDLPTRWVGWGTERLRSRNNLIEQVETLRKRNLRLRARQLKFETLQSTNKRLRELLDASAQRTDQVQVARLLSVDLDPYRQQVVVNQGSRDGVYRGQPLIDAYGVMGQIVRVGPMTATALLISDPNHALPAQINRNGLRTVAEGTGEPDRLKLRYILNNADVRVGDAVVTSGLGGRFPANYPIATVVRVQRQPGRPFAHVWAQPRAHLDRSREVLLVWPDGHTREQQAPDQGTAASAHAAGDSEMSARETHDASDATP